MELELDFDKYCVVDGSPTTVLQPSSHRRRSKVDKKAVKLIPGIQKDVDKKTVKELHCSNKDFSEINFHRFRSVSCKTATRAPLEYNEVRNRSSVYQSSNEVRLSRNAGAAEGRKKIEVSFNKANLFPSGIVESLCDSDEDDSQAEEKRSSVISLSSDFSTATSSKTDTEFQPRDPFDQIRGIPRFPPDNCSKASVLTNGTRHSGVANRLLTHEMFKSRPVSLPSRDGNTLLERDPSVTLQKSLSATLAFPQSPSLSESSNSRTSSPKTRFSTVRNLFDPFVKSKSQRTPLGSSLRPPRENQNKNPNNEAYSQLLPSSPAHLHGLLKLDGKQALPSFEFSVKFPEDVLVAKTWKAENGLDWIYTFDSMKEGRRSTVSGRGSKENHKASSMVGQMQVSCYSCAEPNNYGSSENSLVTEFVLYDIAHRRNSVSSGDNHCCETNVPTESKVFDEHSLLVQPKHNHGCGEPLAAAELHPSFQIGAVVVQVPYEKRESLKVKSGDRETDKPLVDFLDSHESVCSSSTKVNVVVPSGNHGLPTTECHYPSPLLDRWRSGGHCDCGGWDMACPINILSDPNIRVSKDGLLITDQQPLELFLQGKRDKMPSLTLKRLEDGLYFVNFHAQLSTLQAFSVCLAVLHSMESSVRVKPDQAEQLPQRDSLRFIKEEVKSLVNAVTEEGKCRDSNKRMQQAALPSFIVNPPFSPIARV